MSRTRSRAPRQSRAQQARAERASELRTQAKKSRLTVPNIESRMQRRHPPTSRRAAAGRSRQGRMRAEGARREAASSGWRGWWSRWSSVSASEAGAAAMVAEAVVVVAAAMTASEVAAAAESLLAATAATAWRAPTPTPPNPLPRFLSLRREEAGYGRGGEDAPCRPRPSCRWRRRVNRVVSVAAAAVRRSVGGGAVWRRRQLQGRALISCHLPPAWN